jgi:hypothetical protein
MEDDGDGSESDDPVSDVLFPPRDLLIERATFLMRESVGSRGERADSESVMVGTASDTCQSSAQVAYESIYYCRGH